MAAIDFIKEWDVKKHGWPALIVAVMFLSYEAFWPKDPTCTKEVIFITEENKELRRTIAKKDSESRVLNNELLEKNHIIRITDSTYRRKVVAPAKAIIKKYDHER